MADLSHWGFAESFTAHEAAVLILGINDEEARLVKNALRIGVITRRMKQAYSLSLDCEIFSIFGGEFPPADSGGDTLESIELDKAKSYDEGAFAEWLNSGKSAFEKQLFSRAKLTRWIAAVKQASKDSRIDNNALQVAEMPTEKPLGTRERDTLLAIIAALCHEAKIDYKKPAKAANLIVSAAASMGVSIGETTIEGHLKKIPDALGTRVK